MPPGGRSSMVCCVPPMEPMIELLHGPHPSGLVVSLDDVMIMWCEPGRIRYCCLK